MPLSLPCLPPCVRTLAESTHGEVQATVTTAEVEGYPGPHAGRVAPSVPFLHPAQQAQKSQLLANNTSSRHLDYPNYTDTTPLVDI